MRTRTLRGGPWNGEVKEWPDGMAYEVHHPCPTSPDFELDRSRYDHEGNYVESRHPGSPIIEPCGKCDLCPGHVVDVVPGDPYQWEASHG